MVCRRLSSCNVQSVTLRYVRVQLTNCGSHAVSHHYLPVLTQLQVFSVATELSLLWTCGLLHGGKLCDVNKHLEVNVNALETLMSLKCLVVWRGWSRLKYLEISKGMNPSVCWHLPSYLPIDVHSNGKTNQASATRKYPNKENIDLHKITSIC